MDFIDIDYDSSSSSEEETDEVVEIDLPVTKHRTEIINAVRNSQFVIITGETGCGKSTKLPQYLLEAGFGKTGVIGMTQPRRIAVISTAKRIASERRCAIGKEVGYQIRFDSKFTSATKLKIMTEGILLNEIQSDKKLRDYSVIILDEAHERSINCDLLMGLLHEIARQRVDLRVILCSATIMPDVYANYFNKAAVVRVKGSLYPVEVIYNAHKVPDFKIVKESVRLIHQIHSNRQGHVLVFFPGINHILECFKQLYLTPNLILCTLYGGMSLDAQKKAFKNVPPHQTKVVLATNVAETSITIRGIQNVIDSGYFNRSGYDPKLDCDTLETVRISKAQADQRLGRAGRTNAGKCYRLYREVDYFESNEDFYSEIYCSNLSRMYLKLMALGVMPQTFNYFDLPAENSLQFAKEELTELSLIDAGNRLTEHGRNVSDLPIEPRLGKIIVNSIGKNSFFDILSLCAMLPEKFIFLKSWKPNYRDIRASFDDVNGDLFSLLNLYKEWKMQNNQKQWCREFSINVHTMREVDMVVDQLCLILQRNRSIIPRVFAGNRTEIKKAFITVFYKNICIKYLGDWDSEMFLVQVINRSSVHLSKDSSCSRTGVGQVCVFYKACKVNDQRIADVVLPIEEEMINHFWNEMKIINFYKTKEYLLDDIDDCW